jgi:hypothetical protein
MVTDKDVHLLTLTGLSHRCAQESDLFFQRREHDPRYCFELFRRAVVHRNERAWELVYTQYRPLVSGWVERHSLFTAVNEETAYFVNWAFEKMWSVMSPEKFAGFPDLKSVLRYLQLCVHSVLVDYMRTSEQAALLEDLGVDDESGRLTAAYHTSGSALEDNVMARLERQELWRQINDRLKDERERHVLYGSFVLGLKPAELCNQFAGSFHDVTEVYRVKENLLARLRRDEELREFWGDA